MWHKLFTSKQRSLEDFWTYLQIHTQTHRKEPFMAKAESTVTITAKEAVDKHGGVKKVLTSGMVFSITPHHRRTINVGEVVEVGSKETIVKNDRGKRRVIPTPSIASVTVAAEFTQQIQQAS